MSKITQRLKFEITLTEEDFKRLVKSKKLLIKQYPILNSKFDYYLIIEKKRGGK